MVFQNNYTYSKLVLNICNLRYKFFKGMYSATNIMYDLPSIFVPVIAFHFKGSEKKTTYAISHFAFSHTYLTLAIFKLNNFLLGLIYVFFSNMLYTGHCQVQYYSTLTLTCHSLHCIELVQELWNVAKWDSMCFLSPQSYGIQWIWK